MVRKKYDAPRGLVRRPGSPNGYILIDKKYRSTGETDINLAKAKQLELEVKRLRGFAEKGVTAYPDGHGSLNLPIGEKPLKVDSLNVETSFFEIKTKDGEVICSSKKPEDMQRAVKILKELREDPDVTRIERKPNPHQLVRKEGSPNWWAKLKVGDADLLKDTQTEDYETATKILEKLRQLLEKKRPDPESVRKGVEASQRARMIYDEIAQEQIRSRKWGGFDVYFVQAGENGPIKIGIATNFEIRLRDLNVSNPCEVKVLALIRGNKKQERALHKRFAHLHIKGEWFRPEEELLQFCDELSKRNDNLESVSF